MILLTLQRGIILIFSFFLLYILIKLILHVVKSLCSLYSGYLRVTSNEYNLMVNAKMSPFSVITSRELCGVQLQHVMAKIYPFSICYEDPISNFMCVLHVFLNAVMLLGGVLFFNGLQFSLKYALYHYHCRYLFIVTSSIYCLLRVDNFVFILFRTNSYNIIIILYINRNYFPNG